MYKHPFFVNIFIVFFEVKTLAKKGSVVRYHKSNNFNIGFLIFFIIIIYAIFHIFSFLTKNTVAKYEVGQGSIATNYVYKGFIIRDETICYSDENGFLNYYKKNGTKVSVNDVICSVDTTGDISKEITQAEQDGTNLNAEMLSEISSQLSTFSNAYKNEEFYSAYTFHEDLDSDIRQILSMTALNDISDQVQIAETNHTFFKFYSDKPGIIAYYMDGYEDVSVNSFDPSCFSLDYVKEKLDARTEVSAGDPLYKRVNSENWNIFIPISNEMAEQMNEDEYVKVRFCQDDFVCNASYSIVKKDEKYYLNLLFRTGMMRYINERFVDIELVLGQRTGLKIPNSAITSKEFFTIPKEYFTLGGDSKEYSLLIQNYDKDNKQVVNLVQPTIYYETDEFFYVDSEFVDIGDKILMNDSSSIYTVGDDTDSLIGVYNINKGYAVFKQIDIISQNESYTIVESKTAYGIALYDHIALDGSKVKENDLITH